MVVLLGIVTALVLEMKGSGGGSGVGVAFKIAVSTPSKSVQATFAVPFHQNKSVALFVKFPDPPSAVSEETVGSQLRGAARTAGIANQGRKENARDKQEQLFIANRERNTKETKPSGRIESALDKEADETHCFRLGGVSGA